MQQFDLHYTAHYNWEWVVHAALLTLKEKTQHENELSLQSCPRFKDLPSTKNSATKERVTYSLFRVDLSPSNEDFELVRKVRTRSDIFGFLDPKDSLARVCQLLHSTDCMPDTVLIPWDWLAQDRLSADGEDSEVGSRIGMMLSSGPKLLKAPLGSGGFGLYFVYSVRDVEEIIRCHRNKAEEKEGFMEDLRHTFYGFKSDSVLAWSLQDVISGVRVVPPIIQNSAELCDTNNNNSAGAGAMDVTATSRRCQVRAYIGMVNDQLYLYQVYEVRLPSWDLDLDATLSTEYALYSDAAKDKTTSTTDNDATLHTPSWTSELENEYCGNGHGRPYNEYRNKGSTERYVLSELTELNGSEKAIENCMRTMFTALKPVVVSRQRKTHTTNEAISSDKDGSSTASAAKKDLGHVFDWEEITLATKTAIQPTDTENFKNNSVLSEVAIVGVDLVLQQDPVTQDFSARIVEINNNPAMPAAEGKHMSALYKQHLVDFVASTIQLAMYGDSDRLCSEGMDLQLQALKFDVL